MNTQATTFELALINPKNGSKFSPNLFKWLKHEKQQHFIDQIQAHVGESNNIFLGFKCDNGFIGARLNQILCGGSKASRFFYTSPENFKLLPGFVAEYHRIGRCAIDVDHSVHFIGHETRWKEKGNTRRCLWCGECTQTKNEWIESIRKSYWVNVGGLR